MALFLFQVEIIANDQGNRTTPSYVAFTDTERLIGDAAKNQVAINPSNTIFDAKRLIGRKFNESSVQSDMKHWPFEVSSTFSCLQSNVWHQHLAVFPRNPRIFEVSILFWKILRSRFLVPWAKWDVWLTK